MIRSYTGRKRFRKSFGRIKESTPLPDLISLQKNSYDAFLQQGVPASERKPIGLLGIFNSFFPIKDNSGKAQLDFQGYHFDEPKYTESECKKRGGTYSSSLRGKFRFVVWDIDNDTGSKTIKDIKEQDVYLGDIPLMTDSGTFVFNGIERVIVSQMHRSPGAFIDHDNGKTHSSGKFLYAARIIPYRGSWIDFEFDHKDLLYVRVDRRRKVLASTFLMCIESRETEEYRKTLSPEEEIDPKFITGMSKEEILGSFYEAVTYKKQTNGWSCPFDKAMFKGGKPEYDVLNGENGEILFKAGEKITPRLLNMAVRSGVKSILVPQEFLEGQYLAYDNIDESNGIINFEAGDQITAESFELFDSLKLQEISVLSISPTSGPYMINTIAAGKSNNREEALLAFYKAMRPGDLPSIAGAESLLHSMIFDPDRYDLSEVGRAKINDKLGFDSTNTIRTLQKRDLLGIANVLFDVKDGIGLIDDIDNLGNRRIRSVGELIENQCRIGMLRMERTIREKMSSTEVDTYIPSDLINAKPLIASIKDFFVSSQLSQFMDQNNPLSEVTHKRRLSALGPGGLSRERAGFEVRDVHPTHYSRLCPIETPEGQNIGLINSLATYAKINQYGFIESPYRRVTDCKVTDEVVYVTATEENKYTVAQADVKIDKDSNIVDDLVICRKAGEVGLHPKSEVTLCDVSPKQVVSVAASLIPFLENDDASRALMGSNMQRQAVPLIKSEAPLVGTGMESVIAKDSGAAVVAKRSGVVDYVDSRRIVIRVTDTGNDENEAGADVYGLSKFECSNMGTCINQLPLVKSGDIIQAGDIIADGPAMDCGELALGRNVLVAFMSWQGYNFEDSIVLSENMVKDDVFSSIHIESFEVMSRDTKLGNEEITRDIPNVSEEILKNLDESGIVYVGAHVRPGDILVGKVTPKGESPITPEEKLLRAIFGEKSADVRDSSFRVPPGIQGTVVDVRVLMRRGVEKDERAMAIERQQIEDFARDRDDEKRILEHAYAKHLCEKFIGTKFSSGLDSIEKGAVLTKEDLQNLTFYQLKNIVVEGKKNMAHVKAIVATFNERVDKIQKIFEESVHKLRKGDDLPAGVLKLVKVFVATKRKIQPGDKMAGRHGNKGVVSRVLPIEDMPYLSDGTPVDIILNPLGLPSRMNVGQILETHLGAAAKGLGDWINKILKKYREGRISLADLRYEVEAIYDDKDDIDDLKNLDDTEFIELSSNLSKGIPMATPVFDGARLEDIESHLQRAGLDKSGQTVVFDGRTGKRFDRPVTIGYIYMLKLHHLVDDKIHARSVGPYSLVTQQPLGGKAQFGGQRFGEMEVWALEAYGAAHVLREMLTVKSDDVNGRTKVYESIVKGENEVDPEIPESFNVLVKEIRSLAMNLSFEKTSE